MRKSLLALLGAAGVAVAIVAALGNQTPSRAADHGDSPAVAADPTTDIADLYAWMSGDELVVAMTVFGGATSGAQFSDSALYVVNIGSGSGFGATSASTRLICRFDTDQTIHCWLGDEYLTGDASATAGVTNTAGSIRVFAGLRDDPFFFNGAGFGAVAAAVNSAATSPDDPLYPITDVLDEAACPADLPPEVAAALVATLSSDGGGVANTGTDSFMGNNVLAIVVQIDVSLVSSGGDTLAVWASTNQAGS